MITINHLFDRNSILFIGSDGEYIHKLVAMVKDEGFTHFVAKDMASARRLIGNEVPDVVFVMWEFHQDIENLRGLCKNPHSSVFLIAEPSIANEDAFKTFKLGADDFLTKPIDQYQLRARVYLGVKLSKAMRHVDQESNPNRGAKLLSATGLQEENLSGV